MSFKEWFAPTKTSVALPPSTTFQRTKSQRNWLFKTHSEAFLGNLDLPRLISRETRAQGSGRKQTQPGSLLAVGEIFDLKNTKSSRITTCPVVALAAGEAGHILQLAAINPETWKWGGSDFVAGASQANFQGSWCSDGSSISKIEFATKLKQYDTIRWLIVQRDASTTIFEPELRAKPVAGTASMSGGEDGTAEHIAMNPVASLTINMTGGESHCDFSMNLGSNELGPQIAIIDRSGNWSIWYIGRTGHGRTRAIKAVLMKKGSWQFPNPSPSIPDPQRTAYRVVWTSRSNRFDEWQRESSPSTHSDPVADNSQAAFLVDLDRSRLKGDGLLVCDQTQLQVLDVEGERTPSRLIFARKYGMDTILDARAFCGSSFHVFVLTTDKLYLLDVTLVEGQEVKSPHILASCHHFRNDPAEVLKISTTKLRSAYGEVSTLVAVYSAQSFRVDLLWFILDQRDGTARFHRQVVHFQGLGTANMGLPQGIESLAAVPLHVTPSKGKGHQTSPEKTDLFTQADDTQLYQLFALTADLSLSSSIVALTQGVQQNLLIPVKSGSLSWTDERRTRFLRRKWLRETDQAFVVPDKTEVAKPSSVVNVPKQAHGHDTIQLRFYMLKLVQEINRAYAGDTAQGSVNSTGVELFESVQAAMNSREEDEHDALKPLSKFSDLWRPLDLSTLNDEWDFNIRRLQKSQHAKIFECGAYGAKQSIMEFFEKLSINWSATLPAESLKANQWRYMELALERMAAEVYMSERGIYMVPQSTLDLISQSVPEEALVKGEEDDYGFPSSQPRSSQALPTPSATPSSSRATSEAVDSTADSQEDKDIGLEDPAVARLRIFLPSMKFTPPPKSGPSRVISLWPEQRGIDPSEYEYRAPGQEPDERAEARRRHQERKEELRRRRKEKQARLGIKIEGTGESYSQPYQPPMIRSSPPPQDVGSSTQHIASSPGFGGPGLGSQSQSQGLSQEIGISQMMSQPVPGQFGRRPGLKKGKAKAKGFK